MCTSPSASGILSEGLVGSEGLDHLPPTFVDPLDKETDVV